MTEQEMNLVMLSSFNNFKRIFLDRMDIIGISVLPPVYQIAPEELSVLVNELHQD